MNLFCEILYKILPKNCLCPMVMIIPYGFGPARRNSDKMLIFLAELLFLIVYQGNAKLQMKVFSILNKQTRTAAL